MDLQKLIIASATTSVSILPILPNLEGFTE